MSSQSSSVRPGVYTLLRPVAGVAPCPLVMDSPHSGQFLPADFQFTCSTDALQASADTLVDQLIAHAPECGASVLLADVSRTYIDLNRALDDVDPGLTQDPLPWPIHPTKRTQFGLGLIHTQARGQAIYTAPLTAQTVVERVQNYYTPYQDCLRQLIDAAHTQFNSVLHLNVHAMPSMTIEGKLLPDIVIGDLDGVSSHRVWRETVKDLFKAAGFVVTVNTPYKGVEIIRRTGKPRQGAHALQIEINKALYLDEQTLQPNANYTDCLAVMNSIWQTLSGILVDHAGERHSHRDAAE